MIFKGQTGQNEQIHNKGKSSKLTGQMWTIQNFLIMTYSNSVHCVIVVLSLKAVLENEDVFHSELSIVVSCHLNRQGVCRILINTAQCSRCFT